MGNNTVSVKHSSALLAGVMALVVALTLAVPANAYAAAYSAADAGSIDSPVVKTQALTSATPSKTIKKASYTNSTSVIKKKAIAVKQGTTKLSAKSGQGYIKFTATKKKTYSFTFSNLKSAKAGEHVYSAFVEVQTQDKSSPKYSFMTNVATKGGKNTTLWLAEKGFQSKGGKLAYRGLTTRTGKIKLNKGQDIYFYFYNGTKNTNFTLKVA